MCSKQFKTVSLKLLFKSRVHQCLYCCPVRDPAWQSEVTAHHRNKSHWCHLLGSRSLSQHQNFLRDRKGANYNTFADRDPSIILLFHLFLSLVYYFCSVQRKVFFIVCISLTALPSEAIKKPFLCVSLNTQWGGATVKGSNGFSLFFFLWERQRNALFSLSTEETVLFCIKEMHKNNKGMSTDKTFQFGIWNPGGRKRKITHSHFFLACLF